MGLKVDAGRGWPKTEAWLKRLQSQDIYATLEQFAQRGVEALSAATPVDTGATARSWTYEIVRSKGYFSIRWMNTNNEGGVPIAILLQYGHGTGTGGYVQGRDYINPAIRPIFDQIEAEVRKVVTG